MLSTYLNALIDSGLAIDQVVKPEPDEAWRACHPEAAVMPVYLAVSTTLTGRTA